jgi:hypothetical protein
MSTLLAPRTAEVAKGAQVRLCSHIHKDGRGPCEGWAMVGSDYCKEHGGYLPSGAAHPGFKTGKYSRLAAAMPKYLREKSEEALEDWESLTDLSDKLSAQEAMLVDLYEKLPTGESGETWRALKTHWEAHDKACKMLTKCTTGSKAWEEWEYQRVNALEQVEHLILFGAAEWQTREAIGKELDRYTNIASVETKRREKAANVQSMFLVKALLGIIQQYTANEHKGTVQRLISGLFTGRGR